LKLSPEQNLKFRTPNVVATVAPMIGLLGTVSGMIGAFQTISSGGMGRPELLAGDIGEALITTATGLVIGIPAMIAYFIFRNRLSNRMIEILQTATHLVDHLSGDITPPENDSS
jgi:biopolymer transport protein ExbB